MPSALFTLAYTYNDGIDKEKGITLVEIHQGSCCRYSGIRLFRKYAYGKTKLKQRIKVLGGTIKRGYP
jgi:hypothetical protein